MINKSLIEEARKADLPAYLVEKGFKLKCEGKQFRVMGISGLIVADNYWYNHVQQRGGNSLDYVIHVEGRNFVDAVAALKSCVRKTRDIEATQLRMCEGFELPPMNNDNSRVLSYLVNTRGIPYCVLHPYIVNGRIYEARGSHNCVFTGLDCDTGEARYAFERSSSPKSNIMFETRGSNKHFSFSLIGHTKTLLVFEAAIDILSYMSMEPGDVRKDAFYLSLGGLSEKALDRFTRKWSAITEVVFCFDNDKFADEAYLKLGERYMSYGYSVSRHKPVCKDWNAQLLRSGYFFPAPPIPWEVIP